MVELAIVLAMLVGLLSVPAVFIWFPWEWVLEAAVVALAVGLLLGVPAGLLYHLRLYALARPRPSGRWWLHPTAHHGLLPAPARPEVLFWFKLGAAGFVLAVAGCALFAIGFTRAVR
jgi:hypothetical protein